MSMGGGGSIQGMSNSLKMNRHQLGKRIKLFSRERRISQLRGKFNEEIENSGIKEIQKISYEQRKAIRKKIAKQQRFEKTLTFSIAIVVILIAGIIFWPSKISENNIDTTAQTVIYSSTRIKYLNYLKYGDTWLEDKEWKAASTLYQKALDLYPTSYNAKYRLALSYSYSCAYQYYNCYEGKKLLQDLRTSFPENKTQYAILDSIFSLDKTKPVVLKSTKKTLAAVKE